MLLSCLLILHTIRPSIAQLPTSKATSALTQPFIHPTRGDVLVPGSLFTIRWDANPTFKTVTLQLWDKTSWGFARDLLSPCHPWARNPFCGTIAADAPNTGVFDWQVPDPPAGAAGSAFPRDQRAYWLKMYVEDYLHADAGNTEPVLSYSQNFAFAGVGEQGTLVTEVPSSTSAWDAGPPTVFVTVLDNGTASATGEGGGVRETDTGTVEATGSRVGNKTALVPVEGRAARAARVERSLIGIVMLMLGLV